MTAVVYDSIRCIRIVIPTVFLTLEAVGIPYMMKEFQILMEKLAMYPPPYITNIHPSSQLK